MLRLINIKVKGFRLLDDDFELSFVNKNRVSENELNGEMMQIDDGVYTHKTTAFVGANASGKSSILSLILSTLSFLKFGRWGETDLSFSRDKMDFSVMFYLDSFLYKYSSTFIKNSSEMFSTNMFSKITNEKLFRSKFDKNRGKANILAFEEAKEDVTGLYLGKTLFDTSSLVELTGMHVNYDLFNTNVANSFDTVTVRNSFFNLLKSANPDLMMSIFRLLDNSIEYIRYDGNSSITYKRFSEPRKKVSKSELLSLLSAGTIRGFELYLRAISILNSGGLFVVDEIENSFQKNLVFTLLFLFNDAKTNPKNAQLIFSTHYVEVLDVINRRDGIFVTSKVSGKVNVKNLASFDIRPDKVKSRDFNSNAFGTFTTYDEMMDLKRRIADA